ncbi:MAG: sulfatase [bacterium]|nr:sulfatase [bacterium]
MNSRQATLGASVLLLALAGCGQQAEAPRPNILYIMTDDHAAHMLSIYGSRIASTPNLDRIGNQGMRFANAFCTNSLCAPSRATLLTGKYSHRNGQRTNRETFDGSQQTFPKLLRQAGYQTAIIGKWHLKSEPTGFDYWNVLPGQGDYHDPVLIDNGEETKHTGYVTDIITDLALEWLGKRDSSKPFLLMFHHKAPHARWVPDEKHIRMFEDQVIAAPDTFDDDLKGRARPIQEAKNLIWPDLRDRFASWTDYGKSVPEGLSPEAEEEAVFQRYVKDYMRVVASVDDNVGRVLDYLDESGLTEDTVVIYTTDNGMFVGDHGMFDKRWMYEEALRVPLLVRYPRAIKPGSLTERFALNVDYAPTILDYAGVEAPADMQGRSLRPVLEDEAPPDWRESFYYHYYEFPAQHNVRKHYGVRTQRYKLMHFYEDIDAWELIDLENDPEERRNVYDDTAHAETVDRLKAEVDRLRRELEVGDGE